MKRLNEVIKFKLNETYKGYGDVKGINFTLIDRIDNNALFKRSDGYYEVITLKHQKAKSDVIAGRKIELKEKEIYPYGESWLGKCVKDRVTAQGYFNVLCNGKR